MIPQRQHFLKSIKLLSHKCLNVANQVMQVFWGKNTHHLLYSIVQTIPSAAEQIWTNAITRMYRCLWRANNKKPRHAELSPMLIHIGTPLYCLPEKCLCEKWFWKKQNWTMQYRSCYSQEYTTGAAILHPSQNNGISGFQDLFLMLCGQKGFVCKRWELDPRFVPSMESILYLHELPLILGDLGLQVFWIRSKRNHS